MQIRRHGFDKENNDQGREADRQRPTPWTPPANKDGVFDNVAFVTVFSSDDCRCARIPVPLLDDQPVVLAVNVAEDAGSLLAFQKPDWELRRDSGWQEQNELFREINEGAKADKRAELMKKIEEGWPTHPRAKWSA